MMTGVTDVKTVCCAHRINDPRSSGWIFGHCSSRMRSHCFVEPRGIGKWRFAVSDGGVELVDRGELAINGLRALASACWMSAVEGVVEKKRSR